MRELDSFSMELRVSSVCSSLEVASEMLMAQNHLRKSGHIGGPVRMFPRGRRRDVHRMPTPLDTRLQLNGRYDEITGGTGSKSRVSLD